MHPVKSTFLKVSADGKYAMKVRSNEQTQKAIMVHRRTYINDNVL